MLHSNQPDSKSLIIREAHSADVPVLDRLSSRYPNTHSERLQKQLAYEATYFIALIHGKHVGHVLLLWNGVSANEVKSVVQRCPGIEDLFINKMYRSRGIGTALIEECVKSVKEKGYHQIGLSVGIKNIQAKQLYNRLGFLDSGISEYYVEWPFIDKITGEEKKEGEMCRFLIKHI